MKRKSNPLRFRKRTATNHSDLDPRSTLLRAIRDAVQRQQFEQALGQINQELGTAVDPKYRAKLLGLAADCFFKQGEFSDAAGAYGKISQLMAGEPLLWLRPMFGQIGALLKNGQVQAAVDQAANAVQTALAYEQQYQAIVAQADAMLKAGQQVTIPAQPPQSGLVAVRLAKLFFSEGEVTTAKTFYEQALQLNGAGTQARIGLAEIALREGNATETVTQAKGALTLGQFGAKTLPAWTLLAASASKAGIDVLDPSLINGLKSVSPTVRARAMLLLVRGLRNQGDGRWQNVADAWLEGEGQTQQPVAAELRKLKLATARLSHAAASDQLQAAQALLNVPGLGPTEWLAAAKQVVNASLILKSAPDIDGLINQGASLYGQNRVAPLTHGLALACRGASRLDLATNLLQRNVSAQQPGTAEMGRSLWTLAKLQTQQGQDSEAAASYLAYSQTATMPARFRLYALLEWTRAVSRAGQPELMVQAKPQLEAALPQITDYELVLDLARQILGSPLEKSFALEIFTRGQKLALSAFDTSSHPSPAATILFKLARRANDFARYDVITASWTRMSDQQRQWLWSERGDFWNYVELVFRAYRDSGMPSQAEAFIDPFLNDPATPPHGYAILGVSYAAMKRSQGDQASMFNVYDRMIQVAPTHEWTSAAYYWFGLRAWKRGNVVQTKAFGDRMLLALGGDWTMKWKQEMAANAWCLRSGLNITQVPADAKLSVDKLQAQLQVVQGDLARLTA